MSTAEATYSAPNELTDQSLPIARIRASTFNPRRNFDPEQLQELADSIREHGLLEPIVVRVIPGKVSSDTYFYEVVAGERRFRACTMLGMKSIPVRIHPALDDAAALKISIIENVQRVDLDPLEEAAGYRALAGLGMKQREIAESVNRSQPAVANAMRLLDLPESVQQRIREGALSASHGIALASFKANSHVQEALAEEAAREKWPTKKLEGYFGDVQSYHLPDSLKQFVYTLGDGGRCLWDWKAECKGSCPHDAFRASDRDWIGWCLCPACYEQKTRAAKRATEEAVEAKLAEAGIAGTTMLKCRDLGYDGTDYHEFGRVTKPPVGCEADCPKRVKALSRYDQVVEICSDAKCWRKLGMAATRAESKAGRELLAVLLPQMERRVDALASVGSMEMAVVAQGALIQEWKLRRYIEAACNRQGQAALWTAIDAGYGGMAKRLDALAEAGAGAVARVMVEGVCRWELTERYQERSRSDSATADWYLGPRADCDVCIPAQCSERCEFVEGGEGGNG